MVGYRDLIDKRRLSRDYEANPLLPAKPQMKAMPRERPPIEDLQYLFNELNLTMRECGDFFGFPPMTMLRVINEYGLYDKPFNERFIDSGLPPGNDKLLGRANRSKLTRNYAAYPLRTELSVIGRRKLWRLEMPTKEELEYLLNTVGLAPSVLAKYFQVNILIFRRWLEKDLYNIRIRPDLALSRRVAGAVKRLRDPAVQLEMQTKARAAIKQKYGVEHLGQIESSKPKRIASYKEWLNKQGGRKKLCKIQSNPKLRKKIKETHHRKYGGWVINLPKIEAKRLKAYYDNIDEIVRKIKITKLKNSMPTVYQELETEFNPAINEEESIAGALDKIYNVLRSKYQGVERDWYDDRTDYLFHFYIRDTKTFVNYNGFWTHGDAPFDSENIKHCLKAEQWEARAANQKTGYIYKHAIQTWCVDDPKMRKQMTGRNYKELFNLFEASHV